MSWSSNRNSLNCTYTLSEWVMQRNVSCCTSGVCSGLGKIKRRRKSGEKERASTHARFQTESQSRLFRLAVQLRIPLNSWSSCLHSPSAGLQMYAFTPGLNIYFVQNEFVLFGLLWGSNPLSPFRSDMIPTVSSRVTWGLQSECRDRICFHFPCDPVGR